MGHRAGGRVMVWSARLLLVVASWLLLGVSVAAAQEGADPPAFVIAPYLLDVTGQSATVAFHLSDPRAAEVRVQVGEEQRRFVADQARRVHFITVTGLSPGQVYLYEVSCGDGGPATPPGDGSYQIRTANRPGEAFTFTAYGDPRPGDNQSHRHHRMVVDQMLLVEPAFSLVLGDMVDDGASAALWTEFFEVEAELRRRSAIFPVLGDNDQAEGRGRAADYFPTAARGPYRFEWGGVHFFGMNAWGTLGAQPPDELGPDSEQLRWLDRELSRDDVGAAPFRVVFLHDPIVISRGRASEILERVWAPLLSRRSVDLVLASWHLYERLQQDRITYVISGGAGAELVWLPQRPGVVAQAEAKRHHFCRVDVKPGAMQVRAVAEDGTVLDSFTLLPRTTGGATSPTAVQRQARALRREITLGEPTAGPSLVVRLFSYDCRYCRQLLERDLPRWTREAGVPLKVHYYDLGLPGTYDLLVAAGADFGRQNAPVPTVFVGRSVLGGREEISQAMAGELARYAEDPGKYREQAVVPFGETRDTQQIRTAQFEALTVAVIVAAGLLDGINPCAFTTIVFLLSYLTVAGRTRRQILLTGGIFTLAVFLTYLAIGALFYQLASSVMGHPTVAAAVHGILLMVLVVLAALSARDTVYCFRGQETDIALKLPAFLQERIRARIRSFARNAAAIGVASFTLGVIIASMELACTGQVYIPIVTMIAEPQYRAAAAVHLLVYNLAFIL
ncbi:MAG: hypothetical protein JRI68_21900, partial [Deltaproteobacteria bacterium]|nr:hypothetical protein [Deltaproteobacteria bacterium]